ncbi:hypothetical protein LEP1GSC132_1127 [Leptospira kirschneri str. 200803703]|uniref:Uncharacterized protein n=2 Tax=Leptospira kirschneri TaxID=29507 RepID=A0A828Y734_9LEPT|nr:hypothetical protein [Leptospira kirschneri]EMO74237.1 hypothetical protein LEP1GSC127_4193 [Leptospira kirschneri str. 200801925]EKO52326.1 hypothetical protein LEP1GSC131_4497 [Leptospira kirschneri str. 200802841]EMK07789.1 hypothetical protein LEP1GSC176_1865 [Leptospira kirschneri str. MMD1493]EMO68822.1 hypothetical protein LEP1GSC132_1127 [Leptospira kirschneri str. 200803703]EMO80188.1 hypothetical protein LEP1GSC126_3327 [Leptospira kirschneri str. 200801774]
MSNGKFEIDKDEIPHRELSDYYVFHNALTEECARLTTRPWGELPRRQRSWYSGHRIPVDVVISQPLKHEIEPDDEGVMIPYFSAAIPLMSHALIEAFREAGVDNLELYQAVIDETRTGRKYEDYSAVNIIGLVTSTNPQKSFEPILGNQSSGAGWFKGILIAPEQAQGLLLFRLAESVDLVIVHRCVKEVVEKKAFSSWLRFINATDYHG